MKVFGALFLLAAANAAAIGYFLLEGPSALIAVSNAVLSIFLSFRAAAAAREGTSRIAVAALGVPPAVIAAAVVLGGQSSIGALRLVAGL